MADTDDYARTVYHGNRSLVAKSPAEYAELVAAGWRDSRAEADGYQPESPEEKAKRIANDGIATH